MTMTRNIELAGSLRLALKADAAASGAMGVLLVAAGGALAEPLGAPAGLLVSAGAALLAYAAFVLWAALRSSPHPGPARAIVAANVLWVALSVATAFAGWFPLTTLGQVFVLAQAAAVALLSLWQVTALRHL
jgi:hypothetical protein